MFDVLIRNGTIVDGTGETWFHGGIGILGDSLTILRGDASKDLESSRVIDASGKVVCPDLLICIRIPIYHC